MENKHFGNPKDAPTDMVKRCLELCRIPVDEFIIEDLRLMIGQEFSLQYLIRLAIEYLKIDILREGDLYPGDLLKNVLSINTKFWVGNKELWNEINDLIKDRRDELATQRISTTVFDSIK